MSDSVFQEWLKKDLEKKGYVGEDLEGQFTLCLSYIPKSLQSLAEDALFRNSAKLPLQLYIDSLSDTDKKVQTKRSLLERFLKEGKQVQA
ncbi:hypothetical protein [Ectobacillus panaciterrae]|uniref:hypothetical protein n=1 Tax=Ectobacillus panaciterrae TaxID=363872 RepID=UPI00040FB7A0|nr:hypothetical protein [Ectobacillus panaciterrae]